MFGFTRKVDYALIALTALALEDIAGGDALSARQIAERYQLPAPMLMNVLKHMNKAGLVCATRGSRGGYRLCQSPDKMHLIDILEVIEGPIRVTPCCHDVETPKTVHTTKSSGASGGDQCGVMPRCPIVQPMKRLHQRMINMLSDTTLADLMTPPTLTPRLPATRLPMAEP